MKKIFASTFIFSKALSLFCFSSMGLMGFMPQAEAKIPCHQAVVTSDFNLEACDACELAVKAWSEEYTVVAPASIEAGAVLRASAFAESVAETVISQTLKQVYRPPPTVIFVNAFHRPQLSTVLIV